MTDFGSGSDSLPGQSDYQRLELLGIQLQLRNLPVARPDKAPLVQATRGQPDAEAVMHQHFNAVGPLVGEQTSAVRLRHTEDRHHPGSAVSVPARMSMGSVATQIRSMRIIAGDHA